MVDPYSLSPISLKWQSLFDLYLTIGTAVGVVVMSLLAYTLLRYRYKEGGPEPGDAIKPGRLPAERGTVGAALILTVVVAGILFVVSFSTMQASEFFEKVPEASGVPGAVSYVEMLGGHPSSHQSPVQVQDGSVLVVKVEGFQWGWKFIYPNGKEMVNQAIVPAGKVVVFEITSSDVFHKFHLPQFKTGADAIPGKVNMVWMATKIVGEYIVQCYELCGVGHAYMKARINVVSGQDFQGWYGGA
ncbi:MAG: cytochrome c oxidase subunit II [Candidatus Caldarchaeum sp.]